MYYYADLDDSLGLGYETDRDDERGARLQRGGTSSHSRSRSRSNRVSLGDEASLFCIPVAASPPELSIFTGNPPTASRSYTMEPSSSYATSFAPSSSTPSTASTSFSFSFSDSHLSDDADPQFHTPSTSLDTTPDLGDLKDKGKGKSRVRTASTEFQRSSNSPPRLPPLEFSSPRLPYRVIGWETDGEMEVDGDGSRSHPTTHLLETSHSTSIIHTQPSLLSRTLSLNQVRNDSTSTISQPIVFQPAPLSLRGLGVKLKKSKGSLSLKTKKFLNIGSSGRNTPSNLSYSDERLSASEREEHLSDGSLHIAPKPSTSRRKRKGKGRSYTYPLPSSSSRETRSPAPDTPAPSLADEVDAVPALEESQEEEVILPDYFTTLLPRELKLFVFATLMELHVEDLDKRIQSGGWTAFRASNEKWVGRQGAARELVKISRVSKEWQRLAFDGQLWPKLDVPDYFPLSLLSRITSTAGSFVRTIDLSGYHHLETDTLPLISSSLSNPRSSLDFIRGEGSTNLTTINLKGCTSITTRALHLLLKAAPALENVCLRGLNAVTNTTCETLLAFCPRLVSLDVGRCANMDAFGIRRIAEGEYGSERTVRPLKELRIPGLKRVSTDLLFTLARGLPGLEVLDLSCSKDLDDPAIESFVKWDPFLTSSSSSITLTSRQMGLDPASTTTYTKRLTRLRHLSLSSCPLLTDVSCARLAHTVPLLEFFEFAGIGRNVQDTGLVHMLKTTPLIRRIDLEDASEITNAVLQALTPSISAPSEWKRGVLIPPPPQPGEALEHLVLSYAINLTTDAFIALIRACPHLRVLEVDNTPVTDEVIREFVKISRKRKLKEAELTAVDCRHVGKAIISELGTSGAVRHRRGWRDWEARGLGYIDSRDEAGVLPGGQDECDESKVTLKTFWTWQTVDSALAARDSRRKAKGDRYEGGSGERGEAGSSSRGGRWWSSRRSMSVSAAQLVTPDLGDDERGCIIM